jgi:hypothetical protein
LLIHTVCAWNYRGRDFKRLLCGGNGLDNKSWRAEEEGGGGGGEEEEEGRGRGEEEEVKYVDDEGKMKEEDKEEIRS